MKGVNLIDKIDHVKTKYSEIMIIELRKRKDIFDYMKISKILVN